MANRYVRASAFRHVHGEMAKLEQQFMGNLRALGKQISANDKYWAVACSGGGGPIAVCELDKPGRHNNYFQIQVHSGPVEQAEFSPFAVNLIASASNDAYIKLSSIPSGCDLFTAEPVIKADREIQGHYKKVEFLKWNPTAENIIASASPDNMVKFWDIEEAKELESFNKEIDQPTCLSWNENGSQVVVGSKGDGKFYMFDPRAEGAAASYEGFAKKAQGTEYVYADNQSILIGVGRSATNSRQYKLWDLKKMDTAIVTKDIDQAAGILVPYYDPDNSVLYLAGNGDANISYYELSGGQLYFLSSFSDKSPQKCTAWRPKRSLNVKSCEIAGCLRLMSSTTGSTVEPVSFQVPRKSDLFQKDLYPDTAAGIPGATSAEWLAGKNGEVKKQSMKPGDAVVAKEAVTMAKVKSAAEYEAEIAELRAEIAALKAKYEP
eukprot:gb/GEZN01001991.1/.p1 GENE.gb/GEZN01001991.1/~~gb/GEZN01001991.1/.p1  ORF type:complete len:435 (+),score=73.66 gb/GEZN01001991.1/:1289-2593(+)